jgi:hypothetical protein
METKTINLRDVPEELVRRAKAYAALRGLSLKDFIIQSVQQALDEAGPEMANMAFFVHPATKGKERTRRRRRK